MRKIWKSLTSDNFLKPGPLTAPGTDTEVRGQTRNAGRGPPGCGYWKWPMLWAKNPLSVLAALSLRKEAMSMRPAAHFMFDKCTFLL